MSMVREARPPLTTIGKRKATLDGQTISYIIKRSPMAKYARLEVRPQTGLAVVIPKSYRLTQIPSLLKEKRRWILAKLAKCGHIRLLSAEKEVESGDTIPYLGRNLRVVKRKNDGEAHSIKVEGKRLVVSLKSTKARLNLVLEEWYRREAEKLIRKRVDELRSRLGITYGRLSIRGARTRWGSCSQKGNLNFNWKLMMAPEPVIDYVIIHELAHLKEMNHTKKFWSLVAQHCPQWRKHRKWLKDHEAELSTKLPG
jgi:predicted metal-dependent hydrolase